MNRSSNKDKIAWFVVFSFCFLFLFSPLANSAEYTVTYPSFLEEFYWTYGCTPTAASMVLSYWDTSHWDRDHRSKFVGMGRLIDYYYIHQCSYYNVPNTISELAAALATDYFDSYCLGSGDTYDWNIDDGIRYVTNTRNGYNFTSSTDCSTVWPDIGGDWCWGSITSEIFPGRRPFVWSTGDSITSGHSVAAWGYTDDKYVILYDTWAGDGRQDWYYTHYLNDSNNSIVIAQVNIVVPPAPSERSDSDIVLDDPVNGEKLFIGTSYPIWWYQWGTQIQTVNISYSLDSGMTWNFLSSWNTPYNPNPGDRWGVYYWNVPNTPSNIARIRVEAFDNANNYIAGDGSFGNFRILSDTTQPAGTISINGPNPTTNPNVTLTLTCADGQDGSGCADMRFSNDSVTWSPWEVFASSKAWTLTGSDGGKTVWAQFRDKVGNISRGTFASITLDRTGPKATIAINNGSAYTTTNAVAIYISCTSGDCVQMRFSDTYAAGWTAWEPYFSSKSYTFATSPANGREGIVAEFKDALGNSSSASDDIILDLEAPTGSLLINNNAQYTNTTSVAFTLECYDWQSGCSQMRFSNDNITWTAWEPIAASKAWTLPGGEGMKTVYFQYMDNVGHTSGIGSDTIVFETTAPTGSVIINNNEASTNTTFATLTLSCNDPTSGCFAMRFSNDGSTWTPWEPFAANKPWVLTSGEGIKRVYVQYKDNAGNIATLSNTIVLETIFLLSTIDAALTPGYSSIAVDSNNKVHVSSPGGALRYATNASGSWVVTFVDKAAGYSSIAVDSLNAVHIGYYDSADKVLKYATNAGGRWVTTIVDSTGDTGNFTSVAVDSNRKVHISYYDVSNMDLKYATNASGSWVISTIDSAGRVGEYSSVAVDSNNKVHISYYDGTNYDLKYATNANGNWVTTALETDMGAGMYSSLAVDSNNKVHISYYGNYYGDLKYITNASGTWVAETVDARGQYSSIAIDSNNKVHIVSYNTTTYKLRYATNTSGAWVVSAIDNAGNNPTYPSIAVDSGDKPHISYFDTTGRGNSELRQAENTSGVWAVSTVESAANPVGDTSIAVDSNGKIHISYHYIYQYQHPILLDWEVGYGLKYATNASGLWVKTIVDSEGSEMEKAGTSIALDANNKVHISYFSFARYPVDHRLKYATNASGSWVLSTIESSTTDHIGYYSSIAVDKNDKVHIGYSSTTPGPLKYATNASGSWATSSIAVAGGTELSMALDSGGKAHIGYHSGSWLSYATNSSGVWVSSGVDSSGGSYPSIAIDSENHAHISHVYAYYDNNISRGVLKYATNMTGSWAGTTVDDTVLVYYTAIDIDSKNKAHIVYYALWESKLKYATNVSGSWLTSTIDDEGDAGRDPSLAIDTNDIVHISYVGGGIKYGRSPDTARPKGSITINGGSAYSNTGSVTLVFSASDPSGVIQMCISNTPSCSSWETYTVSRSWTLPSGDGAKTVYVRFKDGDGDINATPYSNSIILDTTVPFDGNLSAVPDNARILLSWNGFSDATSGLKSYILVYDTTGIPSSCSAGTKIYSGTGTSYSHSGLTNGMTYYYRVCALDNVVNISSGATVSATPDLLTLLVPDGDLDGDGVISIADALKALRIAAGLIAATDADKAKGDVAPLVNGKSQPDGKIDLGDVVVILRRSVGL